MQFLLCRMMIMQSGANNVCSYHKGDQRVPIAFEKSLALIKKIFKKYFEQQDEAEDETDLRLT